MIECLLVALFLLRVHQQGEILKVIQDVTKPAKQIVAENPSIRVANAIWKLSGKVLVMSKCGKSFVLCGRHEQVQPGINDWMIESIGVVGIPVSIGTFE